MARLSNDDVATVLAEIANELDKVGRAGQEALNDPNMIPKFMVTQSFALIQSALTIVDFVDNQSKNFQDAYYNKLDQCPEE